MKTQLEGTDSSIEISLKEYGFAWIERENEFRFYYGIQTNANGEHISFDWGYFKKDLDLWEECNWINEKSKESFLDTTGMTQKEFDAMSLPNKIFDLVNYYGYENIFGVSYVGMTYSQVRMQANRIPWKDK